MFDRTTSDSGSSCSTSPIRPQPDASRRSRADAPHGQEAPAATPTSAASEEVVEGQAVSLPEEEVSSLLDAFHAVFIAGFFFVYWGKGIFLGRGLLKLERALPQDGGAANSAGFPAKIIR